MAEIQDVLIILILAGAFCFMVFGITQCTLDEQRYTHEEDLKTLGTLQGCLKQCGVQHQDGTPSEKSCMELCREHFNINATKQIQDAQNTLGGCMRSCDGLSNDQEKICVSSCEYHYNVK